MSPSMTQILLAVAALLSIAGCGAIASCGYRTRHGRIKRQIERVTARGGPVTPAGKVGRLGVALGRWTLRRSGEFQDLARLTQSAGYFSPVAPYRFVAAQLGSGVGLAIAAAIASETFGLSGSFPPLSAIAGFSAGYLLPRVVLQVLGAQRRRRIRRELLFFVDMLLLLLRGGASIDRCFREIAQLGHDAIPEIHRTVDSLVIDVDQGRSYDEGLDRWADRMSDPSAREIARQLQQAMTYGTEMSKMLGQFSQRLINHMLSSARERAGRRSTYVTVATLIFFLPPLIIVLAAPGFTSVIRLMTSN